MRIEGSYRPANAGRASATRSGSGGAVFSLGESSAAADAGGVAHTSASPTIDSLLALQSVEDPLEGRRKAVRRGRALLDVLDDIKADLLAGRIGESRLNALMALIGQARERAEPGVDGVLDEIELRARVELAKLGRYPGPEAG